VEDYKLVNWSEGTKEFVEVQHSVNSKVLRDGKGEQQSTFNTQCTFEVWKTG